MAAHSNKIGGSSAARALACPGSIPLAAKAPKQEPSEFAALGTALHNCMEALLNDPEMTVESLLGTTQTVDGFEIEITQEHLDEKIMPALRAFDEFLNDIESEGNAEAEFEVEARVEWQRPLAGCFGTGDVIGRAGHIGFVLDWKFGDGVLVSAKDNTQLRFYAGAASETRLTAEFFDGVTAIWGAIVQPSAQRESALDIDVFTLADLDTLKKNLTMALNNSVKGVEAMKIGPHCRWCPAKPVCPKMHNTAADAVEREVNVEYLEEDLRLAADLESWIASVRKLAHETLESGTEIPGWKLVAKRALRKWRDTDELLEWARKKQLVKKLFPQKPITPAAAEKANLKVPQDLIVKSSSGTTLAPQDDKRPAVVSTAGIGKIAEQAGIKT